MRQDVQTKAKENRNITVRQNLSKLKYKPLTNVEESEFVEDKQSDDFVFPIYNEEAEVKQEKGSANLREMEVRISVDGEIVDKEAIMVSFALQKLTCFTRGKLLSSAFMKYRMIDENYSAL